MIAANEHTILVLENSALPQLTWAASHVPAILEAWSPGKTGPHAVASTLLGMNNPAGRLPAEIRALEDAGNTNELKRPNAGTAGGDTDPAKAKAVFPLGFGLSYTSFRYSGLEVHIPELGSKGDIDVVVVLTNTGKAEGDEVAQLYLHHEISSVQVADRTLIGFQRVHLLAGERRTLTFKVPQELLEVWNTEKRWSVEPGPYKLFAGGSSAAVLNTSFTMGEPSWARTSTPDGNRWIFAPTLETKGTPLLSLPRRISWLFV